MKRRKQKFLTKIKILKILLLVVLLAIPQISITNSSFTAQGKVNGNSVSAGWWVKPTVTVISPNGGEMWITGSSHDITWTALSSDPAGTINSVDILLSSDGGATYPIILASGLPNTGTYSWTISSPKSSTMKVKVVATDNHGLVGSDESDGIFDPAEEPAPTPITIPTPTLTVSTTPTPTIDLSPAVTLAVLDNLKTASFTVTNIANFVKLSYELTYDTDSTPQGVIGETSLSGQNEYTKDNIILGTCSSGGTCVYHRGIKNINLKITLQKGDGSVTTLEKTP